MSARGLNRNDGAHGKLAGGQSKGMLEGPELPALRLALRTCYRIPVYVGGAVSYRIFCSKNPKDLCPYKCKHSALLYCVCASSNLLCLTFPMPVNI